MSNELPAFIKDYKTLYNELHTEAEPQVSVTELDARIVKITTALHETQAAPPVAVAIEPEDVKILTLNEVQDVNKRARTKLWNSSPWYKKVIIRVMEFLTRGRYTGIHQIPVKEFITSVSLYVEKAKVTQLAEALKNSIPPLKSGHLETHTPPVGENNCFFIWKNIESKSKNKNNFTVSVLENGNWKDQKCTITDKTIQIGTLFSIEIKPQEDAAELFMRLSQKIETMLNVKPYGKVHFDTLMKPYYETASVRKAEGKVDVAVVALAPADSGYTLSTLMPESDKIKRETVTVGLNGTVLLQEIDEDDMPIEDKTRNFTTVEKFKKEIDNPTSWPLSQALQFIATGPVKQNAITKSHDELLVGAEESGLFAQSDEVEKLKAEITHQLTCGLSPHRAGAFVYETSDPSLLKVVYATDDGVVEKDLTIKGDGSVVWLGKTYSNDVPLSVVLDIDNKPLFSMQASRKNLKDLPDREIPLKDLCAELRNDKSFYYGKLVKGNPVGLTWKPGSWAIAPEPNKMIVQGWKDWIIGAPPQFTSFILWVHDGNKLKRYTVQIDPARSKTPYGIAGKWYSTPEDVARGLHGNLLESKPAAKIAKSNPSAKPAPLLLPRVPKQQKPLALLPPSQPKQQKPVRQPMQTVLIPPPGLGRNRPPGPGLWSRLVGSLFSGTSSTPNPQPPKAEEKPPAPQAPQAGAPAPRVDNYDNNYDYNNDDEPLDAPAPDVDDDIDMPHVAPMQQNRQQIRDRLDDLAMTYRPLKEKGMTQDKAKITWALETNAKYGLTKTRQAMVEHHAPAATRAEFDKLIGDLGFHIVKDEVKRRM